MLLKIARLKAPRKRALNYNSPESKPYFENRIIIKLT